MNKLLSCRYNMDTNRVEARFKDGTTLAIDCIAVEDEYGNTPEKRAELDWLLYNKPLEYAEILIDHAWGYEPCGMEQIKSYKPSTNSISEGQVLSTPYPYDKAKLIVREMAEILMFRLTEKKLVTESLTLEVGYDRENVDKGGYRGLTQTDRYGRVIPKAAHGTIRFDAPTNLGSTIMATMFMCWTGHCIWTKAHPTSTSAMCSTVRTSTERWHPSRKRRWKR